MGLGCYDHERLVHPFLRASIIYLMVYHDWRRFGIYGVVESINAGVDLEMPGINRWREFDKISRSVQSRKILPRTIKARARKVLELVQKCAKATPEVRTFIPSFAISYEIVTYHCLVDHGRRWSRT